MRSIHIRIGHNDNFVIADFFCIHAIFGIIAYPGSDRRNQRAYFSRGEHFIQPGPFHIQDFAAQGQNGLIGPVPPLFGRTAS